MGTTWEAADLSFCLDAVKSFKMLAVSIYSQSYCLVFGTSVSIKNKAWLLKSFVIESNMFVYKNPESQSVQNLDFCFSYCPKNTQYASTACGS